MIRALALAFYLLQAEASESATCTDTQKKGTSCSHQPYQKKQVADTDACCALCAADDECKQWTFHSDINKNCRLTNNAEPEKEKEGATCGIKSPAPTPPTPPTPPSPPGPATTWAVLIAGSSGYGNYRHQADVCHAYQILKKRSIPADQIIVLAVDDIAHSSQNPFPGKIFNKPTKKGEPGVDVYAGCNIDYRGNDVTPTTFVNVLTGVQDGPTNGNKVLKSDSNSRVFVNFVDHGGVGLIGFPKTTMHVKQLSQALETMQQKKMFSELLFYLEACESGSMFPDLTSSGKIFAVTAANAKESSWGTYCPPQDMVDGKHLQSCLGDLFSVNWMEDTDLAKSGETISQQVQIVKQETAKKSHVTIFGDQSFENEPINNFEMKDDQVRLNVSEDIMHQGHVDVRDIPLYLAYDRWNTSRTEQEKAIAWKELQDIRHQRKTDDGLFVAITEKACEGLANWGCAEGLQKSKKELRDYDCHMTLTRVIENECPAHKQRNAGGWNAYSMQYSQWLVNMCEVRTALKQDVQALEAIVRAKCVSAVNAVQQDVFTI